MAELILTMGLPFSGKTEWSRKWVDREPSSRMRLCRSDFRRMAMTRVPKRRRAAIEDAITAGLTATAKAALQSGVSVVVDDVNLVPSHREQWEELASELGIEIWIEDFLFEPLDSILERRRRASGENRITERKLRDMYAQYAHTEEED
jgi:predicted kinase